MHVLWRILDPLAFPRSQSCICLLNVVSPGCSRRDWSVHVLWWTFGFVGVPSCPEVHTLPRCGYSRVLAACLVGTCPVEVILFRWPLAKGGGTPDRAQCGPRRLPWHRACRRWRGQAGPLAHTARCSRVALVMFSYARHLLLSHCLRVTRLVAEGDRSDDVFLLPASSPGTGAVLANIYGRITGDRQEEKYML